MTPSQALLASAFTVVSCFAQESPHRLGLLPNGIGFQMGIGTLAIRDESISREKYAGTITWLRAGWTTVHETYGYRVNLLYERASSIKNYNVSGELTQGALEIQNLYPVGAVSIYGTDAAFFLGPAADMFAQFWKEHVAESRSSTGDAFNSGTWLLELGARCEAHASLGSGFSAESAVQTSLLSVGGGATNDAKKSTSALLTALAGVQASFEAAVRYVPLEVISLAAGYRLHVLRIDSWNYVLSASDSFYLSLVVSL